MSAVAAPPAPRLPGRSFSWPRLRFTLLASLPFGLLMSIGSATSTRVWLLRTALVALMALLGFGLLERWPVRLPRRLARWVAQLLGLFVAVPLGAFLAYALTTGELTWWRSEPLRLQGFLGLCVAGTLFGPWIGLAAMVRQREALVAHQALSFQLEKSELERRALDARMRLLQAQVQPHFLFNTLANVRALVNAGSPRASPVLDSLIAYLRAAVPRLDEPSSTLRQELQLVRAYLELMQMRMPDRLQFELRADEAALDLVCPSMTLMTLVENAVRHGIDPGEEGGRIDISLERHGDRCRVRVADSGVGLSTQAAGGEGTGLATLRERLRLTYGDAASLRLSGRVPHGVVAEVEFPAEGSPPSRPP